MMKSIISNEDALNVIQQTQILNNYIVQESFFFTGLLDENEEYQGDILVENCIFYQNFGVPTGYFYGQITIRNCEIQGSLILFGMFTYQPLLVENCHCLCPSQLCSGGFYKGVSLINNIFEGFVDFADQDIRDQAIISQNRFVGGTNLMHPKGGPSGAHFAFPPYLEGNTGLDQYERPKR